MKPFRCSTCVNLSTRPRIVFDDNGRCNACVWAERKAQMDWGERQEQLHALLDEHRGSKPYDCVVPVSGGKDGSYVAHQLKHVFGMHPLTITVRPPLSLALGDANLDGFAASGYTNLRLSVDPEAMRQLNLHGLIEMGFPYYGWLIAIQSGVLRIAASLGISLVFYGEDGEVEYGGTLETQTNPFYDIDYMRKIYLEGGHDRVLKVSGLRSDQQYFFEFPGEHEFPASGLKIVHWSYFENWDPYRNYLVARDHCGLKEADATNSGTFTNFAQNDQMLYALHTYLMYLKFGFGRATQDAGIEIRRGSMTREQALALVSIFDGQFPEEYLASYLDYYGLSSAEFDGILDRWANKTLFEKSGGRWTPKFAF